MSYFGIPKEVMTPLAMVIMFAGFGLGPYVLKKLGDVKIGCSTTLMFVFGGMFVGIGVNPAKGAPNGSPGMVYAGLILLFVALLMTIFAIVSHKIKALDSDSVKKKVGPIVLVTAIVVVGIGIAIAIASSPSGGSGASTNTCQSCGRTFEAGDSAGNYKNISRTNMCNNCYNNYKDMEQFIGK